MLVYEFPGTNLVPLTITWTPTVTASAGTFGSITYNRREAFRVGQMVYLHLDFTITDAGTASGTVVFPPPVVPLAGTFPVILGRENALTGQTLIAVLDPLGGTGNFWAWRVSTATTIGTGRRNVFAGFYIGA